MEFFTSLFSRVETVTQETAIPGRAEPLFKPNEIHAVLKSSTVPPFPKNTKWIIFGIGCFWGAERLFWKLNGVYSTQVGYCGGFTKNPTYEETCTGKTGHNEVVRVIYEPKKIKLSNLLKVFWESHDPTLLNKQGNDVGTMYRSAVYCADKFDLEEVEKSKADFQKQLDNNGFGKIVTEVKVTEEFYYAEDYHQQYLHKHPGGYCSIRGTGVECI